VLSGSASMAEKRRQPPRAFCGPELRVPSVLKRAREDASPIVAAAWQRLASCDPESMRSTSIGAAGFCSRSAGNNRGRNGSAVQYRDDDGNGPPCGI